MLMMGDLRISVNLKRTVLQSMAVVAFKSLLSSWKSLHHERFLCCFISTLKLIRGTKQYKASSCTTAVFCNVYDHSNLTNMLVNYSLCLKIEMKDNVI
jgi:hypothetical protein